MAALLQSEHLVLYLTALVFAALVPVTPGLASPGNAANLLANLLPLLVVALGQTVVLISGGIDLSVTSTIALTSVAGGWIMNGETGWLAGSPLATPVAVTVMLLLGALIGSANGLAVARLRMPPFIVTLTSMMFLSGLAIWLTQSRNLYQLPPSFTVLGRNLAASFGIAVVITVVLHLLLARSLFGRWLYAVGQNSRAARVSGVPCAGVTLGAYVCSGLLAACASVLYTGRLETASPVLGQRILLDVVGATVIGGTSLFGGRGKVAWTLSGVLFLTVLDNALNLLGRTYFTIMMAKGAVILLAAWLDATRRAATQRETAPPGAP